MLIEDYKKELVNTEVKSTGCIFSSTFAILSIKSTLYSLAYNKA